MALTFPAPSPGLEYTSPDGVLYVYNGTLSAWVKANAIQANTTGASALTGAILTPGGNDAARPGTLVTGMLRYNDQAGLPAILEFYNGSAWATVPTGGGFMGNVIYGVGTTGAPGIVTVSHATVDLAKSYIILNMNEGAGGSGGRVNSRTTTSFAVLSNPNQTFSYFLIY
jgi:hypothetical protein